MKENMFLKNRLPGDHSPYPLIHQQYYQEYQIVEKSLSQVIHLLQQEEQCYHHIKQAQAQSQAQKKYEGHRSNPRSYQWIS